MDETANCAHLLLSVYKGLNVTEEAFQDAASQVIFFQQKPVLSGNEWRCCRSAHAAFWVYHLVL